MSKSESKSCPIGVSPNRSSFTTGKDRFPDELQALFAEVTALANQLRKTAALVHRENNSSAGGWSILEILDRLGPQTVPGIARIRTLSRQNIQTLVNRLESHGHVALAANPAHKRSRLICLTDAGRSLLASVRRREMSSLERLLSLLPEGRLHPTIKLLCRLRLLLTGIELPPKTVVVGPPDRKRTRALLKRARRRKLALVTVESLAAPSSGQTDESEFPVNLL